MTVRRRDRPRGSTGRGWARSRDMKDGTRCCRALVVRRTPSGPRRAPAAHVPRAPGPGPPGTFRGGRAPGRAERLRPAARRSAPRRRAAPRRRPERAADRTRRRRRRRCATRRQRHRPRARGDPDSGGRRRPCRPCACRRWAPARPAGRRCSAPIAKQRLGRPRPAETGAGARPHRPAAQRPARAAGGVARAAADRRAAGHDRGAGRASARHRPADAPTATRAPARADRPAARDRACARDRSRRPSMLTRSAARVDVAVQRRPRTHHARPRAAHAVGQGPPRGRRDRTQSPRPSGAGQHTVAARPPVRAPHEGAGRMAHPDELRRMRHRVRARWRDEGRRQSLRDEAADRDEWLVAGLPQRQGTMTTCAPTRDRAGAGRLMQRSPSAARGIAQRPRRSAARVAATNSPLSAKRSVVRSPDASVRTTRGRSSSGSPRKIARNAWSAPRRIRRRARRRSRPRAHARRGDAADDRQVAEAPAAAERPRTRQRRAAALLAGCMCPPPQPAARGTCGPVRADPSSPSSTWPTVAQIAPVLPATCARPMPDRRRDRARRGR